MASDLHSNNPPETTGYGVTNADGSTSTTSNRSAQAAAYLTNSREAQSATANGKTISKTGGSRRRKRKQRKRRQRKRRQRGGGGGDTTCASFNTVSPTLPAASGMAVVPDQSSQSVNSQVETATNQQNTAMEMGAYKDQIGQPKGSVPACPQTGTQSGGKRRRTRRRWTSSPNDGPKQFTFNIGGSRKKRNKHKRRKSKRKRKICTRCRTCKCRN